MTEHFIEMISARVLPPPEARTLTQRLTAADEQWGDVRAALCAYASRRSVVSGTELYINLSRFVHELIAEPELRKRILQHLETQLKSEFPAPTGRLFS